MKGLIASVIVVVLLGGLILGCTAPSSQEPIKIGASVALSSTYAYYGGQHQKGMMFALEEINAAGGINGRPLVAVYEDNKSDVNGSVAAFRKLVDVDKVPIVFSSFTGITLPLLPLAEKAQVVEFSPAIFANKFGELNEWGFRIGATEGQLATNAATIAYKNLGLTKAAIFQEDSQIGKDGGSTFQETFQKLGGTIVDVETYRAAQGDYSTQISKVKALNPQVVYIVGQPGGEPGLIGKQMWEQGFKPQIMSNSEEGADFKRLAGPALEGWIYTAPFFDPNSSDPKIQAFVAKYKGRADMEQAMALWYDATNIIAQVMKTSGTTGDQIRQGLAKVKDFPAITGNATCGPNRDFQQILATKIYNKDGVSQPYGK